MLVNNAIVWTERLEEINLLRILNIVPAIMTISSIFVYSFDSHAGLSIVTMTTVWSVRKYWRKRISGK